jgi:hypothetical protein
MPTSRRGAGSDSSRCCPRIARQYETGIQRGTTVALYFRKGDARSVMIKHRFFPTKPPPRNSAADQPVSRNISAAKSALNNRVEFIDLVEHVIQGVTVVNVSTEPDESELDDRS